MAANFTERKLAWLEAVTSAPALHQQWLALAVAVMLATRYLNREKEEAWPSVDTLASKLHATPRNVRRAIDLLVEEGWLIRKRGGHGPKDTNRYRIKEVAHDPLAARRQSHVTGKEVVDDRKSRSHTTPEPVIEPGIEPVSVRPHEKTRSSSRQAGRTSSSVHARSNQSKPFPQKWVFGPAEAEIGIASSAQWDEVRSSEEFEKFRTYYLKKGSWWADWSAKWKDWCERSVTFNAGSQQRKNKVAGAVDGARAFYEQQKAAIHARQAGDAD